MLLPASERGGAYARMPSHPSFTSLAAGASLRMGAPRGGFGLSVAPSGAIEIAPDLNDRPGAMVLLRFALELAWMVRVPDLPPAAATLLAARAAGSFLTLLPSAVRDAALEDPAMPLFLRLAGHVPPLAQLTACWRLLAEADAVAAEPPDLTALHWVERLWPLASPTEALLLQGGDDRLLPSPETAQNRYLCTPWPQPDMVSFSSCTASSISEASQAEAERARQDMFAAALNGPLDAVIDSASDQVTAELLSHFGAEDIAEAVLAASGTDATLLLTGLLAAERPRETMTTILMSPSETGSGVPEAVQGRHFAPCTASGAAVEKGGAVDGFPPGLALVSVALRTPDGLPRPPEAIAAACEAAIDAAVASGHAVLHAIDGSKTGLAAPHLLALDLLADRFKDKLDIVIDACQLRIEPETVRLYLQRGWPVLITGSKFFGAPGFCGAILFPRKRFRRIAGAGRLPNGLGAYTGVSEGRFSRRCPGLLMRWAAALTNMRAFGAMPAADICRSIDIAGARARAAMMRHPHIHLVQSPRPMLGPWSHRPTVLTFALRGKDGFLSAAALRPYYLALATDASASLPASASAASRSLAAQPCRIGQPVQLGGPAQGGLRIAFSAAQITATDDVRPGLATVFGKLAVLLEHTHLA